MRPANHAHDVATVSAMLRRQQLLTLLTSIACVLLAVNALTRQTTTILEPPTRAKSIAVTGDRVDAAWLEEMGAWVAHMMLDASPASIAWQQEQILRWTHPATHGQLQQDMAVQAKRLRETNASTVFWAQQVAPDPEHQKVVVGGQLDTYVNGVRVDGSSRNVSYQLTFSSKGGRMLLKEWAEVPNDDIWLSKAQETALRETKDREKAHAKQ